MKIDNYEVYDLVESIVASGLPMTAEYQTAKFKETVENLTFEGGLQSSPHFKRACKLAANPAGSGHNNFLSGIVVSANVTATNVWWMQFERYHFAQIVSSQSKMHRLQQMLAGEGTGSFHPKVHPDFVPYSECMEDYEELVYNCPCGLELTARITTNYLQLKTMYNQRKNHKLKEWRDFCGWIEKLPFAAEFITGKKELEK